MIVYATYVNGWKNYFLEKMLNCCKIDQNWFEIKFYFIFNSFALNYIEIIFSKMIEKICFKITHPKL